jgi:alanyl aminopeptidase
MALVPKFAHDRGQPVVSKTLEIVGNLDVHIVPANLKPKYQRYISDLYKPRAEELGWKDKPGESDDDRLLRPEVVRAVALRAEDPQFVSRAQKLAPAWLADHQAVDRDMVSVVLDTAARHGDQALFEQYWDAAKKETDEDLQRIILVGVGHFQNPAIMKVAFSRVLTNDIDIRQSLAIFNSIAESEQITTVAFDFVKQNYDAFVAKLPTDFGALLPFVGFGYCDTQHAEEIESYFKDRVEKFAGGPRNLSQVVEAVRLCSVNKEANQPDVVDYLTKY